MNEVISKIEQRISNRFLIFLKKDRFAAFESPAQKESTIPMDLLENRLFDVKDTNEVDGETYYLINSYDNDICWVKTETPVLILNSTPEYVMVKSHNFDDALNAYLDINAKIEENEIYEKRYVVEFKSKLYVGLVENNELVGFVPYESIEFGQVENQFFNFTSESPEVYGDYTLNNSVSLEENIANTSFKIEKFFPSLHVGSFKYKTNIYWFNEKETEIDPSVLKFRENGNKEDIYLDHLLRTLNIEGNNRQKTEQKTNYEKKINYYEGRTERLENRVALLEGKLEKMIKKYNSLKSSKLGRLQLKYWNMKK